MRRRTVAFTAFVAIASLLCSAGCHSRFIDATLTNHTTAPLNLLQVEYPSASFGRQALQPGESFHYRFKLQASGPVKVTWTDAQRHDHTESGPSLDESSEGTLLINFAVQDHAAFQTELHAR